MRNITIFLPALISLMGAAFFGGVGTAGSLKGSVRDGVGNPPTNGLAAAKVQLLFPSGKLSDPVGTDGDGNYQIPDVPDGEYTLIVVKVGYIPRPKTMSKIQIAGDAQAEDVKLFREYGNSAYYSKLAESIKKEATNHPEDSSDYKRKVYTSAWSSLRSFNLPPSSTARFAHELNKQDSSAGELLPDLKYYLDANPENIKNAETRFGQALKGKAELPGKDSLNDLKIDPEIVADLVTFQAKAADSEKQRDAFVQEFLLKWDETAASKRFLDVQKHDLEKRPLNRPPE
jgi:Carboxypeptidase regulatory-like domain